MAWADLPPDVRARAEEVLTERQLEVVKLRASGFSWRRIADAENCSRESARGAFDRATLRLRRSLENA
jgi:DNA-binding CsgD family transcriptional regulator